MIYFNCIIRFWNKTHYLDRCHFCFNKINVCFSLFSDSPYADLIQKIFFEDNKIVSAIFFLSRQSDGTKFGEAEFFSLKGEVEEGSNETYIKKQIEENTFFWSCYYFSFIRAPGNAVPWLTIIVWAWWVTQCHLCRKHFLYLSLLFTCHLVNNNKGRNSSSADLSPLQTHHFAGAVGLQQMKSC